MSIIDEIFNESIFAVRFSNGPSVSLTCSLPPVNVSI